jgi:hypothetical protein
MLGELFEGWKQLMHVMGFTQQIRLEFVFHRL